MKKKKKELRSIYNIIGLINNFRKNFSNTNMIYMDSMKKKEFNSIMKKIFKYSVKYFWNIYVQEGEYIIDTEEGTLFHINTSVKMLQVEIAEM